MFLIIILKTILFWSIIFFFGYKLSAWLLPYNHKEDSIALAGLLGTALYVFLINLLGYWLPIGLVFYLVLIIFFFCGLYLCFINKKNISKWAIDQKWQKKLLFSFFIIFSIVFVVNWRMPIGGDQVLLGCMPEAATIAAGNFPPQMIWMPPHLLPYHYGSHLLAAAINKLTDLPLYLAYDIQVAVLAGVLFLLGFVLIKKFNTKNKIAWWGSFFMLFAGSLSFLKGIKGISILYDKYFIGQHLTAPFKFVFEMIKSLFASSSIERISTYPTNAFGFCLIIGIVYLYFELEKRNKNLLFPITSFILAILALFAETYFVVIIFVLIIFPLFFYIVFRNKLRSIILLKNSLIILIVAIPIAFFQGGVLTYYLGLEKHTLSLIELYGFPKPVKNIEINWTPWLLKSRIGNNGILPIWSFEFLLQWGLLLLLFLWSFFYLYKKRKSKYLIFLILCFGVFFLMPFLFSFPMAVKADGLERFFFPANLIAGLMIGILLAELYLKFALSEKKWQRRGIVFLAVLLIFQAIIFLSIYLTIGYPPAKWNNSNEFFTSSRNFEKPAYDWVKKNTTINDYFLLTEKNERYTSPNLKFILNTGRMAPIYRYYTSDKGGSINIPQFHFFKEIELSCRQELVRALGFKYIFVTDNWILGLEEKCLEQNSTELKFEVKKDNQFIRIYKIKDI